MQVRYTSDCEEFYGKILDNHNVASSVQEISRKETEEIWNKLYPNEPYDIDLTLSNEFSEKLNGAENHTKYDLVLAIERKIPFTYQVILKLRVYILIIRFSSLTFGVIGIETSCEQRSLS